MTFCTKEGTDEYQKKFNQTYNTNFQGLKLSSLGIGLYKGGLDIASRREYQRIIREAIKSGINVFDVARKYRNSLSEKDLGHVLNKVKNRNSLFISSKVGLISFPQKINKRKYIENELILKRGIKPNDIKNSIFCLSSKFINQEVEHSLKNLNLKTLDNLYLHNPEYLEENKIGYKKFFKIFETMENLVINNKIKAFGLSSWSGFRRYGKSSYYIDIKKILDIAKKVAGNSHNLKNIQIPLSISMPFILHKYKIEGESLIEYLKNNKINIFTSATLYEGKLKEFFNLIKIFNSSKLNIDNLNDYNFNNISFPKSEFSLAQLISDLNKISQRPKQWRLKYNKKIYLNALNLVRSISGITTSLCGMEKYSYFKENIKILKMPKLTKKALNNFWDIYR